MAAQRTAGHQAAAACGTGAGVVAGARAGADGSGCGPSVDLGTGIGAGPADTRQRRPVVPVQGGGGTPASADGRGCGPSVGPGTGLAAAPPLGDGAAVAARRAGGHQAAVACGTGGRRAAGAPAGADGSGCGPSVDPGTGVAAAPPLGDGAAVAAQRAGGHQAAVACVTGAGVAAGAPASADGSGCGPSVDPGTGVAAAPPLGDGAAVGSAAGRRTPGSGGLWYRCRLAAGALASADGSGCGPSVDPGTGVAAAPPLGDDAATDGNQATVASACRELRVEKEDFSAVCDRNRRRWTVRWKWSAGTAPAVLENRVQQYKVSAMAKTEYEQELELWIEKDGSCRTTRNVSENHWPYSYDGRIPKEQCKVRPVLDLRESNTYIEAYTADTDVCSEKLREWRRMGRNGEPT